MQIKGENMGGYTYWTKQGDMWDYIAWQVYGDESFVTILYRANPEYLDTYIFSDGVGIYCPEITASEEEDDNIPDWRDSGDMEEDFLDSAGEEGEDE